MIYLLGPMTAVNGDPSKRELNSAGKLRMKKDASKFIRVNGEAVPYRVERRGVRCPRLEFKADELLVILPKGWKDETPLLEEEKGWISKKHAEIRSALKKLGGETKGTPSLPILGDFFKFRENGSLIVDFDEKVIECDPSNRNHLRRLERILKRRLLSELEPAVEEYSKKLGVRFNRKTIKKQRTKWGSCSSNRNLNFNLRLVCLPKDIIRYVACHEVAHLKEKNHGRGFWRLVGREFGNHEQMEKKLFEYWFFVQMYSRSTFLAGII